MKNFILTGCLSIFLMTNLNAQEQKQSSSPETNGMSEVEQELAQDARMQSQRPDASIDQLLNRMDKDRMGNISAVFSPGELQMLRNHFRNTQNRGMMADFTPTAGATETFTPAVGDHFFDPGGPGGSGTDGDPGNYPSCGCDTFSTLSGVSEIEFLAFNVFSDFDYLIIYDGTDATGTILYDNSGGGINDGDRTLSDMITSNGSATFTSTTGNFFFEFHSSTVINREGWDVEIISAAGGGTFPAPYCGPLDFTSTVEPITLVDFANINNVTDATVDGTPAHEDFTSIVGNVEQDASYTITLEGNTAGDWDNSFEVYIDWNQNDLLSDAGEIYQIGTITNSTGTDGQQVSLSITVPATAALGQTRMRVKKLFLGPNGDPCVAGADYGQAEDYTLDISSASSGAVNVYGINNSNIELVGFDATTPSTLNVLGVSPVTVNFENAGAVDPNDTSTAYVLDDQGDFYSVDLSAGGLYTYLGNIAPPGTETWAGMEFDPTSGTLYAISSDGATSSLSSIDLTALTATTIGATSMVLGIGIAIDGGGNAYAYDVADDNLYSINLTTGVGTIIGPIGFDANFGQGMCWDSNTDTVYMSAFNATSFQAEWRSVDTATGATTLIGPLVSSAATTQLSWVSVGPPPATITCEEPTNLAVSPIEETTATLTWDAVSNASLGYEWSVFTSPSDPSTDTPVDTGTTPAGTTTDQATGLTGATTYDFYVSSDCDADGTSFLAGPITFTTDVPPPACGGNFYDTGGPTAEYGNDEITTTVIAPDVTGDGVIVTFTAFNVEANFDALYVYDGPDATFPLIDSGNPATTSGFPAGGYYGTSIPGPFTATHSSGTLTFVFMSDSSVTEAGWEADVTCVPLGVSENKIEGFSYYPNPTTGTLTLSAFDSIEKVVIYNMLGQQVIVKKMNANTTDLDISSLSNGLYIMQVSVNGKTGIYRIIKE